VWQVEISPGTEPTPHSLTREEVFVVIDGVASTSIDGEAARDGPATPSSSRPACPSSWPTAATRPLRMLCCMPVGGQARLPGGDPFTPPWAE
jgi:hypothetical protein